MMEDEAPQEEPAPEPQEAEGAPVEDPSQDKKVTLSDEPEVFNIVPDSTTVEQVEPPKPPPAHQEETLPPQERSVVMDQQDLDKIISETLEVVDRGQKQANDQKLTSQKMAFMLTKILENLYDYEKFVETIETFLANNETLQLEWYNKYYSYLPSYGDYAVSLKDSPEKITVDEIPFPVSEVDLKNMSTDVVNNLYAGGTHVKTQLTMNKAINATIAKRRNFLNEIVAPFPYWFTLMNRSADNQNTIRDKLFKVSAHVGFLKTGESSEPLALDMNKSLRDLEAKSKKSQQNVSNVSTV